MLCTAVRLFTPCFSDCMAVPPERLCLCQLHALPRHLYSFLAQLLGGAAFGFPPQLNSPFNILLYDFLLQDFLPCDAGELYCGFVSAPNCIGVLVLPVVLTSVFGCPRVLKEISGRIDSQSTCE